MSEKKSNLLSLPGIGEKTAQVLIEAGFSSLEKLQKASVEELVAVPTLGKKRVEQIKQSLEEMAEAVATDNKGESTAEAKPKKQKATQPARDEGKIQLSEAVTVRELAERLQVKPKQIIGRMLQKGRMVTMNQPLEGEEAVALAEEFGQEIEVLSVEEKAAVEKEDGRQPRPPVITIMGHVDHGKTTLLDAIRETDVAEREAGGLTQNIGAYQIEHGGRKITFIDTPGHEAFTLMRSRGANVTDIVVLVIAADDGVMPQTLEAIDHAKAAGVPMVVAINKIDKPNVDPHGVKGQLSEHDVVVEDWGGETVCVELSAKKKEGLGDLLEIILLVADLQDLQANHESPASGVVLEAALDRFRGSVATLLVQQGTLSVGDPLIAGNVHGKVRAMLSDLGEQAMTAPPATPVQVLGFQGVPEAGDAFQVVEDDQEARLIGTLRQERERQARLDRIPGVTIEERYRQLRESADKTLRLVVKAESHGSLEAVLQSLRGIKSKELELKILHSGVGDISESDILLAVASETLILGFSVRVEQRASDLAQQEGVDIRTFDVIYHLLEDIESTLIGRMAPKYKDVRVGQAEVREVFRVPGGGRVAGCFVSEGKVRHNAHVRVTRDGDVVHEGRVSSLRRFREDVVEVREGLECGIGVADWDEVKAGDLIEVFEREKVRPTRLQ